MEEDAAYMQLVDSWCAVLLRYDLACLFSADLANAPLDDVLYEYRAEVDEIINRVEKLPGLLDDDETFGLAIKEVFDHYFAEHFKVTFCMKVGRELIENKSRVIDRKKFCFNTKDIVCISRAIEERPFSHLQEHDVVCNSDDNSIQPVLAV